MAVLKSTRTAQWVLNAEFSWNFDDTMIDAVTLVSGNFASAAAHTIDVIGLPPNAVIIGGQLVVTTAFNGTTYPVVIGDSTTANRYLATADRKAAALVPLVPTGYVGLGENLRLTITPTGSTTGGAATVRIQYIVVGRSNEVQIT